MFIPLFFILENGDIEDIFDEEELYNNSNKNLNLNLSNVEEAEIIKD